MTEATMFVLVFGWLAQHRNGWVVLAAGTVLIASGIGISLAGFASHEPLITRIGALMILGALIFAARAVRARRSLARENPGRATLGESRHDG
jgi:drug/metabolite transporter (DMT)-like permease